MWKGKTYLLLLYKIKKNRKKRDKLTTIDSCFKY